MYLEHIMDEFKDVSYMYLKWVNRSNCYEAKLIICKILLFAFKISKEEEEERLSLIHI